MLERTASSPFWEIFPGWQTYRCVFFLLLKLTCDCNFPTKPSVEACWFSSTSGSRPKWQRARLRSARNWLSKSTGNRRWRQQAHSCPRASKRLHLRSIFPHLVDNAHATAGQWGWHTQLTVLPSNTGGAASPHERPHGQAGSLWNSTWESGWWRWRR